MRIKYVLGSALLAAGFAAPAAHANMCRVDSGASCASGMPLGGYCECNIRGQNFGGTIVSGGYGPGTSSSFQPGAPLASPGHNLGEYQ
jgi:hypothetical protein